MNVSSLPFEEAIATAATGDIWLFRGRSLADRAIQTVTNSPVNHVGMVVALDDMPPLLWHAELGKSLPDAWTGERQRGVQLHKLADAVRTWDEKYGQRAWMRRLEGTLEREHEDRLIETIDKYDGKPFPTTPGLTRSWATGRVRRREVSRETIYCAELVAVTMQNMGLLPRQAPDELVRPGQVLVGRRRRAASSRSRSAARSPWSPGDEGRQRAAQLRRVRDDGRHRLPGARARPRARRRWSPPATRGRSSGRPGYLGDEDLRAA